MMAVFCSGSVAFDYLMTFPGYFKDHVLPDRIESISLSFLVDHMVRHRGGIAANIAYTMALLGEKPELFATVGQDFGEYRQFLEKFGVVTRFTKVIHEKFTASFFVTTDRNNAQIASFYPGAMEDSFGLSFKDLQEKPEMVVISPNDPRAMDRNVEECIEMGIPYIYDPSQQIVRMEGKTMRRGVEGAHAVFVNDYEIGLLQKHTKMTLEDMLKCVKFLVVTLGKEGSVVYADGKEYRVPIFPVENIIDPTGTGDAYRGGFLRGYRLGFDWVTCGLMGALTAAWCLENTGTQNHCFTREEFISRFRQRFDDQGKLNALLS